MLRIALSNSLTWLHLLLVSLTFLHTASAAEYGVGFSLSSDYAVSSVYFANGSTQGIAKIEGSPAYKQMMQMQNCSFSKPLSCPRGESFAYPVTKCESSFRDRLPPWLGGRALDEVAEILTPMLRSLKIATESYIGSTVEAVEILSPFYVSEPFLESICLATSELSIHVPFLVNAPNAMFGVRANQRRDYLKWDGKPRYLLSLEFSRSALTAMLLREQDMLVDSLGGFHDMSLGTRHWCEESWNDMEQRLRDLIDIDSVRESGIRALVLLGEFGFDNRLREVLKKILLQDTVISTDMRPDTVSDNDGKGMVDPLFAAAEGLASHCFNMLVYEESKRSRSVYAEL